MNLPKEMLEEGYKIKRVLKSEINPDWDGKKCILELKDADYNRKQMEWIGWYLEYIGRKVLFENYGGAIGPMYGRTTLDYKNKFVWDFKAHPINSSSHPKAIMNDCEAVNKCIEENNGIGFITALGEAEYNDDDGTFRDWHTGLKGGKSAYVKYRIARGAPSRKRKVAFKVKDYLLLFIDSKSSLELAISEGWLSGDAQIGWRNSNGNPRRAKYQINFNLIPDRVKIL